MFRPRHGKIRPTKDGVFSTHMYIIVALSLFRTGHRLTRYHGRAAREARHTYATVADIIVTCTTPTESRNKLSRVFSYKGHENHWRPERFEGTDGVYNHTVFPTSTTTNYV